FAPRLGIVGKDHQNEVVQGIVLMRKYGNTLKALRGVRAKVRELNTWESFRAATGWWPTTIAPIWSTPRCVPCPRISWSEWGWYFSCCFFFWVTCGWQSSRR